MFSQVLASTIQHTFKCGRIKIPKYCFKLSNMVEIFAVYVHIFDMSPPEYCYKMLFKTGHMAEIFTVEDNK